jgi:hypothetical protein
MLAMTDALVPDGEPERDGVDRLGKKEFPLNLGDRGAVTLSSEERSTAGKRDLSGENERLGSAAAPIGRGGDGGGEKRNE